MKIGIEVELHRDNYKIVPYIMNKDKLSLSEFRKVEGFDFLVRLSKEFYRTTVEYNFSILDNNKTNLESVKKFLELNIEKYDLKLFSDAPSFVGTHIHIFDENRINMRIKPLLYGICEYYLSIFDEFEKLDIYSIKRLILGHQLWGNFSYKNEHIWKNVLNEYGLSPYIYSDCESKPKYNPIIYSKATEAGKPKSLEIRIIPNEFIFNGKLIELLDLIEKKKLPRGTNESFIELFRKLIELYNSKSNSVISSINRGMGVNPSSSFIDYIDEVINQNQSQSISSSEEQVLYRGGIGSRRISTTQRAYEEFIEGTVTRVNTLNDRGIPNISNVLEIKQYCKNILGMRIYSDTMFKIYTDIRDFQNVFSGSRFIYYINDNPYGYNGTLKESEVGSHYILYVGNIIYYYKKI